MRIRITVSVTALAVLISIAGSTVSARANDGTNVGIARVSDSAPPVRPHTASRLRTVGYEPAAATGAALPSVYDHARNDPLHPSPATAGSTVGTSSFGPASSPRESSCRTCQHGSNCRNGSGCQNCFGDVGLIPGGALCRHIFHKRCRGCNYSADHGWAPPSKTPVVRAPIRYQHYWPQHWYGQAQSRQTQSAPSYPTVYMPTDTSQLGFYYQQVPSWQPNPTMLPPPPWPARWHGRHASFPRPITSPSAAPTPIPYPKPASGNRVPPPTLDEAPAPAPPNDGNPAQPPVPNSLNKSAIRLD